MDKIISFIMNNFFFVVIIVGILASLLRKSPLEKRQPNRMPDFGGGGNPFPQRRPPSRPGQPQRPNEAPPAEHRTPERPALPERPRRPEMTPAPERPQPVYRTEPAPAKPEPRPTVAEPLPIFIAEETVAAQAYAKAAVPAAVSSSSQAEDDGAMTRADVARAIVWAEILGPPRARRPFRR